MSSVTALTPYRNEGTSVTSTGQTTPSSMDLLAVWVMFGVTGAPTVTGLSDNKGNTFIDSGVSMDGIVGGGGDRKFRLYYCLEAVGGTGHTFTFALSSSQSVLILPTYATSDTGAFTFDQVVKSENGFVGTTFTTGSITPGGANSMLLAAAVEDSIDDNTGVWAASNGFSLSTSMPDQSTTFPGYMVYGGQVAYKELTSATATTTTFTKASGGSQAGTIMASFLEASADVTAPTLTAGPTVINITSSGFDVQGTPDESGAASLLVTAVGATQPSNAAFDASTETAAMTATTQFTINHAS